MWFTTTQEHLQRPVWPGPVYAALQLRRGSAELASTKLRSSEGGSLHSKPKKGDIPLFIAPLTLQIVRHPVSLSLPMAAIVQPPVFALGELRRGYRLYYEAAEAVTA